MGGTAGGSGGGLAGYWLRRAEEASEREAAERKQRRAVRESLPLPPRTRSEFYQDYSEATEETLPHEPTPDEFLWIPTAEETAAGVTVAALNPRSSLIPGPITRLPWRPPIPPVPQRLRPNAAPPNDAVSQRLLLPHEQEDLRLQLHAEREERKRRRIAREEKIQERQRRAAHALLKDHTNTNLPTQSF